MEKDKQVADLLNELYEYLQLSGTAYKEYLSAGKTYRHACVLKKINTRAAELLANKSHLLSTDLRQNAADLLDHYNVWTGKWEALEEELKPGPVDVFVFENEHRFPREAADNLEREYFRLKENN